MKMHYRSPCSQIGRFPQYPHSTSIGTSHCRHQLAHNSHPPSLKQTRQVPSQSKPHSPGQHQRFGLEQVVPGSQPHLTGTVPEKAVPGYSQHFPKPKGLPGTKQQGPQYQQLLSSLVYLGSLCTCCLSHHSLPKAEGQAGTWLPSQHGCSCCQLHCLTGDTGKHKGKVRHLHYERSID